MQISPLEVLALKKLAVICGALANSLSRPSAAIEQRALTSVLVDICNRADLDNARAPFSAEPK